ncbi:glycoside hydrolase family 2 TIM barrel-domain containing protein [Opitutales bacterium ASA1]|uniref:glycoside hydrolase family 2 TIM barrel-domain containing protein n=1 Tax=Congregicoccus parvus TaxID=3081749 RepID=UPI002B32181A|nr:glycoside hydrolase family 2 TIM barrel-domain containing protein [Opitutales bacterium ASA1]
MKTFSLGLRSTAMSLLAVACACGLARAEPTSKLSLDGEWQFRLAPDGDAARALEGFEREEFALTGFAPIPVPSNWTTHGFEEPHYVNGTKSEGFYVHTFDVPEDTTGRRALLRFGGVWQSAEVWLNGQHLGRHDSGFTAFAFDATRALKPGETNRIAVRVRQQTPLFKFDANDDWALPGIYRSVWFEFTPKELFIESVSVETKFDDAFRDAVLRTRVHVARSARADFFALSPPFEVRAVLATLDGTEVQRIVTNNVVQGAHNGRDVPIEMLVRAPAQWTAETPNLYRLTVELVQDGSVLHTWSDRIGFREVSTKGGVLRINGRPVRLRGVARHDQHPDTGRATTREQWLEDINLMKAANINAVRCAHYPHAEGFVRLCDELGIYVIQEIPFGFGGERMPDPIYAEGAFLRVYETIARDRNRPSVIVWSVGNEDPFTSLHLASLRMTKGLDPTRPTLLPFRAESWLPPEVDILAPHYLTAAQYDRLVAAADRPVITTEYTHALGPDDFGELQNRWDAITRHPAGAGGMIWLWADQGLRRRIAGRPVADPMRDKSMYTREGSELVRDKDAGPDEIFDSHGNYGTDGIVDADRAPQRDYWETRAVYAPVRVVEERIPFSPGQRSVRIGVRNDFDFLDLSTVTLRWRLFVDAEVVDQGETVLAAPPRETAMLEVPTTAIEPGAPGAARYVHVSAIRSDGSELSVSSVRLGFEAAARPEPLFPRGNRISTQRAGDFLNVNLGNARYMFNSKTGEFAGLLVGGKSVLGGAKFVAWRPATYSERNRLDRRPRQHDWDTFLGNLAPTLVSFETSEAAGVFSISAKVDYRADENNAVSVAYRYEIGATGTFTVSLEAKPSVEVPELPEIGLEFASSETASRLTWLGEGPLDSLPNKTAATIFGLWSVDASSAAARGSRSTLDWARVSFANGAGVHVLGADGVRLEAHEPARIRVLTTLGGAWTKNGPPEQPQWYLEMREGATFSGSFELVPFSAEPR